MKSDDHGPPTDNIGLRLIGATHPDTVQKEAAAGSHEAEKRTEPPERTEPTERAKILAIPIGVLRARLDAPRGASNDNGEALRPTPA